MKRFSSPRATLLLVLIGTSLVIAADLAIWHFQRSPGKSVVDAPVAELVFADADPEVYGPPVPEASEVKDFSTAQTIIEKMKPAEDIKNATLMPGEKFGPQMQIKKQVVTPKQYWKQHAVPAQAGKDKARIVIIIDDMGMGRKHSYDVINLDAPLTLAFLPYAPKLEEITKDARGKGHELLIHAPMEPMDKLNPGPLALLSSMNDEQLNAALEKMFNSFSGYVGINNHMGSKLTQNTHAMNLVMSRLAERGLIFVDSKTIQTSVAADVAAKHGLDYAERDVFLDHKDNIDFVRNALLETEKVARKRGVAIAIGHPKAATIQGLKEWLPLAQERGFVVVPVSAVVRRDVSQAVALNSHPPKALPKIDPNPLKNPALQLIYGPAPRPVQQP